MTEDEYHYHCIAFDIYILPWVTLLMNKNVLWKKCSMVTDGQIHLSYKCKQILIRKEVISHLEWFLPIWPWFDLIRSNINIPNQRQYNDNDIHPRSWNASDERFRRYKHMYGSNKQTHFGPKKTSVDQI